MRRITLKYAQPGLVLGLPVYGAGGEELLPHNTTLDDECITLLTRAGVTEIFILDSRVADVIVTPMFAPEMESGLGGAFRRLLADRRGKMLQRTNIEQLHLAISRMVDSLHRNVLGQMDLSCAVSQRDYAALQPVKAAQLAMGIGHKMGMSSNELAIAGMAAVLKDISLTDPAMREDTPGFRDHPAGSAEILRQSGLAGTVVDTVLQHHEHWNGSGYPRGLKGDQIGRLAQVVTIADSLSDLTAERPGRGRYMSHEAMEYIMAYSGEDFSPKLVEFVVRHVPSYPNGLMVQLNSGEIAIVSNPNLGFIARPMVRVCWDPEKGRLTRPYDLDLKQSELQRKLIVKVMEYD